MAWAQVGRDEDGEVAGDEGRHNFDNALGGVGLALEYGANRVADIEIAVVRILELLDSEGPGSVLMCCCAWMRDFGTHEASSSVK